MKESNIQKYSVMETAKFDGLKIFFGSQTGKAKVLKFKSISFMDFNFATASLLAHLIKHQTALGIKAAWLDLQDLQILVHEDNAN